MMEFKFRKLYGPYELKFKYELEYTVVVSLHVVWGHRQNLLVEKFQGDVLGLQCFPIPRVPITVAITFIRED